VLVAFSEPGEEQFGNDCLVARLHRLLVPSFAPMTTMPPDRFESLFPTLLRGQTIREACQPWSFFIGEQSLGTNNDGANVSYPKLNGPFPIQAFCDLFF